MFYHGVGGGGYHINFFDKIDNNKINPWMNLRVVTQAELAEKETNKEELVTEQEPANKAVVCRFEKGDTVECIDPGNTCLILGNQYIIRRVEFDNLILLEKNVVAYFKTRFKIIRKKSLTV